MARLRNNIIANFGGQFLVMALGLAFVPIYIRTLGIEAYGLIGFFLSLQAFLLIFDMGLSTTLNRELARRADSSTDADERRDLVRTLEWLYWPMALLIAIGMLALSKPIASTWLKPVSLGPQETTNAIALMGLAAALQWQCGLYAGGLRGLERQVILNGFNAFIAVVRNFGAAGIILFVAPTIEAFLWWQVIVGALQALTSHFVLWRLLPPGKRAPVFRLKHLRDLRGFASGMAGIASLSFLLMQSDRIMLSTLLPLDQFGYYTVAAMIAAALSVAVQPFFGALYPRYSSLVAIDDRAALVSNISIPDNSLVGSDGNGLVIRPRKKDYLGMFLR